MIVIDQLRAFRPCRQPRHQVPDDDHLRIAGFSPLLQQVLPEKLRRF